MTHDDIEDMLKRHQKYVIKEGYYDKNEVVGIFLLSEEKRCSVIVLVPQFKKMCLLDPEWRTIDFSNDDEEKETIQIFDIRFFPDVIATYDFQEIISLKNFIIKPEYEELLTNFFIKNQDPNLMEDGIVEIIKHSLKLEELSQVPKKEFFKQLTNNEERAYYSVVGEIGAKGVVVVTRLIEKSHIPRSFYNSLFKKMKKMKIASISNMGGKGTYIEIIEPQLKAEALALNSNIEN